MSRQAVDVETIDNVSLIFRAAGKSYAVTMDKVNKAMLFGLLPTMVEGPTVAVELSGDFAWEPITKHAAKKEEA